MTDETIDGERIHPDSFLGGPDGNVFGANVETLTCPLCSMANTHVDGHSGYADEGLGEGAVIHLWSECGSKWDLCVAFRKGYSALYARVRTSCQSGLAST